MARCTACLDAAYHRLARTWIAMLAGNLVIVFFILFAVAGPLPPDGAPGLVALQLAFTPARFGDILDQWGSAAVDRYRDTLWLDYLFPLAYATFLASAVAALSAHPQRPPTPARRALFAAPFAAALLDYLENTLHLIVLADRAHLDGALIALASVAAAVKWALIAGAAAALIALLARALRARRRADRPSA